MTDGPRKRRSRRAVDPAAPIRPGDDTGSGAVRSEDESGPIPLAMPDDPEAPPRRRPPSSRSSCAPPAARSTC
jgi:hypothetical protein